MNSLKLAAIAVLVAGFGLLTPSAASADPPYGGCVVELDVDPDSLDGAGSVEGEAEGTPSGGDMEITNDFNGQDESGDSSTDFTFSFPEVDDDEDVTITAEYEVDDVDCEDSVTIELEGQDDEDGDGDGDKKSSGDLPDTGGPDSMIIGTGITLMLVGAGVLYFARRRNQEAA
ncbi:LPXTG cell wall anchor domain-containing protein [Aeromicrobium sp.]|uniref:LPXTG cell wall anchor domain-containing protein n=1 Tax=Aeromicrobium sp. TaxID=1871063 RepID=UPI003D6BB332